MNRKEFNTWWSWWSVTRAHRFRSLDAAWEADMLHRISWRRTLPDFRMLLETYSFQSGQSYAEFRKGDKIAKYGPHYQHAGLAQDR